MIKVEFYMERDDGVRLVRTYSDENLYIERDGEMYCEAIDPEDFGRVYTETDIPIEPTELSAEEALAIITGGEV